LNAATDYRGVLIMSIRMATTIFVSLACAINSSHAGENVGSASELWRQRSTVEKVAYLEGLCAGLEQLSDAQTIGDITCMPLKDVTANKGAIKSRFCGAFWRKRSEVVQHLDTFYEQPDRSDVPNWLAILAYNDKACGESHATEPIRRIQAGAKCYRQLLNMHNEGHEAAVLAAKQAECAKYRR
jgi:hypothetical protein